MSVVRNAQVGGWKVSRRGSSIAVLRRQPGVVTTCTVGDAHVLVDHVSLYVDAAWRIEGVDAAGVPCLTADRWHCRYRFGDDTEAITSELDAGARALVAAMLQELLSQHAQEIGTTLTPDSAAELFSRFEEVSAKLASRRRSVEKFEQRLVEVERQVAAARSALADVAAEHSLLSDRIDELTRTPPLEAGLAGQEG